MIAGKMSSDVSSIYPQDNINSPKLNDGGIYEFENFRLDAASRMLYNEGKPVALAPKVVETLVALIERPGEVVSKDEMMKRLWKDSFVEESNLTQNIYLLRKTLGKTADGQDLIETFRRRGYRFNGEIKEVSEPAAQFVGKREVIDEAVPDGENLPKNSEILDENLKLISVSDETVFTGESNLDDTRFESPQVKKSNRLPLAIFGFVFLGILAFAGWMMFNRPDTKRAGGVPVRSIAVMPLVNDSGNVNTEYLSDGITESLITSLSQLSGLSVKARSSVFRYKGKDVPIKNIGSELSVEAILTGRIAERGDELVINVELVDAQTENILWKADYNRSMANLSTLQNEITRAVAQNLKIKLTGTNEQRFAKNPADSETYQLYLKGRHHLNKMIPIHLNKAAAYFQEAINRDANYAPAYAGLADTYVALAGFHGKDVAPPRENWAKAKEAARKAVELDPQSAVTQIAFANVAKSFDYDVKEAERACLLALRLDPSNADAHSLHADILYLSGKDEEAEAAHRHALELDPLSMPNTIKFGFFLINIKKDGDAVALMKKTMDFDPKLPTTHFVLSRLYMAKAMHAESVEEFATVGDIIGQSEMARKQREIFARDGWEGFLKFEIERYLEGQKTIYLRVSDIAVYYAQLGDRDKTFEFLEQAFYNREPLMLGLRRNRLFENLRPDPRFTDLIRRIEAK